MVELAEPLAAIRAKIRGRIEQDKRSRRQSSTMSSLDVILLIDFKGIPRATKVVGWPALLNGGNIGWAWSLTGRIECHVDGDKSKNISPRLNSEQMMSRFVSGRENIRKTYWTEGRGREERAKESESGLKDSTEEFGAVEKSSTTLYEQLN